MSDINFIVEFNNTHTLYVPDYNKTQPRWGKSKQILENLPADHSFKQDCKNKK